MSHRMNSFLRAQTLASRTLLELDLPLLDMGDLADADSPPMPSSAGDGRIMALWQAVISDAEAIRQWGSRVASGDAFLAQAPPLAWTQARELASALHDSLDLEIGRRVPGRESIELIVTCNGLVDALPLAWAVHEAAPRLPGFKITMLRPRRQPATEFSAADIAVPATRLRMAIGWHSLSRGLVVALCSLDHAPGTTSAWMTVAFDVLDQVLGEQDVMGKVTTVQWMAADTTESLIWLTLDEFPDAFDAVWGKSMQ